MRRCNEADMGRNLRDVMHAWQTLLLRPPPPAEGSRTLIWHYCQGPLAAVALACLLHEAPCRPPPKDLPRL